MSEIKIESSFGECPVQARGTVEGRAFYFRARHNSWSFALYEDSSVSPEMAMDMNAANADFYLEGDYGQTEHEAGYMPPCDVEQLIEQCAAKYQACPRRPRCSCQLTERSCAVRRGTVLRGTVLRRGRKVEVYCYEWIAEPDPQCRALDEDCRARGRRQLWDRYFSVVYEGGQVSTRHLTEDEAIDDFTGKHGRITWLS